MDDLCDRLQAEIEELPKVTGTSMADLLEFSPTLCDLVCTSIRGNGVSLRDLAERADMTEAQIRPLLDALAEKGYLQAQDEDGERLYKPVVGGRSTRVRGAGASKLLDDLIS